MSLRIVGVLVLLAMVVPSTVLAADAFVIVDQPGMLPEIARAASGALERCIPFYASTLKTSLNKQVRVYISATSEAFARNMQEIGGESPARATRFARQFTHVALGYNTFIYQPRMAAETANTSTYGLCLAVGLIFQSQFTTDRRAQAHQWLRQGHSWMLASQALDAFKMDTLAGARERAVRGIREMREKTQGLPRLTTMTTVDGFQDVYERYGGTNTSYFLRTVAEFLLSKSSHEAFVTYFKGMAIVGGLTPNPDDVFRSAFGMTVDQFQAQLDAYLTDLVK